MRVRHYDPQLKGSARRLRKNQTEAEKLLWSKIRKRQLMGLKFQRQFELGTYIVDFVCRDLKVIVELDGGQHNEQETRLYDQQRTLYLESLGFKILRFWNNDVMENIDGVLESIVSYVNSHPSLLSEREGVKKETTL